MKKPLLSLILLANVLANCFFVTDAFAFSLLPTNCNSLEEILAGCAGTASTELQSSMKVTGGIGVAYGPSQEARLKEDFLKTIQNYILGTVGLVTVGIFIYIGFLLFTAEGKEDTFKKAWKALAYAVIGLAIIPLSFVLVRIVLGIKL